MVQGSAYLADVGQQWLRWSYVTGSSHRILDALRQHVVLTAIAVLVGLLISLPLGLVAWRFRRLTTPILGLAGVLYTIPALALFALLVPITGLSRTTAEIGLVSYTLLILVRNLVAGLEAVPPEIREAARGMGMTPLRQLAQDSTDSSDAQSHTEDKNAGISHSGAAQETVRVAGRTDDAA